MFWDVTTNHDFLKLEIRDNISTIQCLVRTTSESMVASCYGMILRYLNYIKCWITLHIKFTSVKVFINIRNPNSWKFESIANLRQNSYVIDFTLIHNFYAYDI